MPLAERSWEALVGGEEAPEVVADLAKGRLRAKREVLMHALAGRFRPHQRFLLAQQLAHIDYLDEAIATVSAEIAERLGPFEDALTRLDSIPGIGRQTAEVLLAEIGLELTRFPTAGHLASWAGLCPGNNESAGKRHSGRTRKGSPWLRTALVEAAQAVSRAKKTYLAAQYHRLVARRGRKKALVAVAHSMPVIAYHLLARGERYMRERRPRSGSAVPPPHAPQCPSGSGSSIGFAEICKNRSPRNGEWCGLRRILLG